MQGTGSKLPSKTSSTVQFDKNTAPVLQETSEWLPDRFHSRDRFQSRESLYMRIVQSPQDLLVYTNMIAVLLFCTPIWQGGNRGWRNFFSCGNNCFYSLSTHSMVRVPHVLRLSSPLSPTQPFFVLSSNASRHCGETENS